MQDACKQALAQEIAQILRKRGPSRCLLELGPPGTGRARAAASSFKLKYDLRKATRRPSQKQKEETPIRSRENQVNDSERATGSDSLTGAGLPRAHATAGLHATCREIGSEFMRKNAPAPALPTWLFDTAVARLPPCGDARAARRCDCKNGTECLRVLNMAELMGQDV
jgi:hypothetical protein